MARALACASSSRSRSLLPSLPPTLARTPRSPTMGVGLCSSPRRSIHYEALCSLRSASRSKVDDFGAVRPDRSEAHRVFVGRSIGDVEELQLLQAREWADVFDHG